MTRLAVLASGSGTNLQAILDAAASPDWPAPVVLVCSDVPGCGALERAEAVGVPTATVTWDSVGSDRVRFTERIVEVLRAHDVELVALAGFMRILAEPAIAAFPDAILNTHPALLPAFRGAHAVSEALRAGVKLTGVTVHVVVPAVDAGPVIAQEAVAVYDDDTEATLHARIQEVEHRLYPKVIAEWARGRWTIVDGRVRQAGVPAAGTAQT